MCGFLKSLVTYFWRKWLGFRANYITIVHLNLFRGISRNIAFWPAILRILSFSRSLLLQCFQVPFIYEGGLIMRLSANLVYTTDAALILYFRPRLHFRIWNLQIYQWSLGWSCRMITATMWDCCGLCNILLNDLSCLHRCNLLDQWSLLLLSIYFFYPLNLIFFIIAALFKWLHFKVLPSD